MTNADSKIDAAAVAAKAKASKVIDDVADLATRAAGKAGEKVQEAGEKVKEAGAKVSSAGERILKLAE